MILKTSKYKNSKRTNWNSDYTKSDLFLRIFDIFFTGSAVIMVIWKFVFICFSVYQQARKAVQEAPCATSACSVRAFLFEVSCKSISRKSLSLIKIENYLLLFLSNTKATIKSLHCKIVVLALFWQQRSSWKNLWRHFFSKVTDCKSQPC